MMEAYNTGYSQAVARPRTYPLVNRPMVERCWAVNSAQRTNQRAMLSKPMLNEPIKTFCWGEAGVQHGVRFMTYRGKATRGKWRWHTSVLCVTEYLTLNRTLLAIWKLTRQRLWAAMFVTRLSRWNRAWRGTRDNILTLLFRCTRTAKPDSSVRNKLRSLRKHLAR